MSPEQTPAELLAPYLGAVAATHLGLLAPRFEAALRGSADNTREQLETRGYPVSAAVLAFEARYGGLFMADEPGGEDSDWLFGAFACVVSGAHGVPGGPGPGADAGLVPVAYSPDDVIYYFDGDGAAWAQDTIEDPAPSRFAASGDVMVTRIVLHDILFSRSYTGNSSELTGQRGDAAAAALGLPLIEQGSDELARFWGDAETLVVEDQLSEPGAWLTRVTGTDKARLAAVVEQLG